MEIIERFRQKSEPTKRRYAFLVASVATAIIGLGWSTTLPARYENIENDANDGNTFGTSQLSDVIEQAESQFGNVVDGVADTRSDEAGGLIEMNMPPLPVLPPVDGSRASDAVLPEAVNVDEDAPEENVKVPTPTPSPRIQPPNIIFESVPPPVDQTTPTPSNP